MERFKLKTKTKVTNWDFVRTFRPPPHLNIGSGNIFSKETLNEGSIDYKYVSEKFLSTYAGGAPILGGRALGGPYKGGLFGGVNANANPAGLVTIKRIEKIMNCVIYDRFVNEFKRMIRKYPLKKTTSIMKHLFHGPNQTKPNLIYGSEDGLDIRFSNNGAYGQGVYFADNSAYSSSFAH